MTAAVHERRTGADVTARRQVSTSLDQIAGKRRAFSGFASSALESIAYITAVAFTFPINAKRIDVACFQTAVTATATKAVAVLFDKPGWARTFAAVAFSIFATKRVVIDAGSANYGDRQICIYIGC